MTFDPETRERRARMEHEAESERRPGDPTAAKPRDARRMGFIIVAALLVGLGAIVAMFVNNSRYDGSSPIPVSERSEKVPQ